MSTPAIRNLVDSPMLVTPTDGTQLRALSLNGISQSKSRHASSENASKAKPIGRAGRPTELFQSARKRAKIDASRKFVSAFLSNNIFLIRYIDLLIKWHAEKTETKKLKVGMKKLISTVKTASLESAVNAMIDSLQSLVDAGTSEADACKDIVWISSAEYYGIDRMTFKRNVKAAWKWRCKGGTGPWVKGSTQQKRGAKTFLAEDHEVQLANWCKMMDSINWSITRDILKNQGRLIAKTLGESSSVRRKKYGNK